MRDQLILLLTYARGMWRYRWYALILSWVVCVSGWVWVYTLPDMYKASARVQVDTKSALTPLLKGLAVKTDIMMHVNIVVKLLMGRNNIENVINETDLKNRATSYGEKEALIGKLQREIVIWSPKKNPELITIAYKYTEPHVAKQVVSKMLDNLVEGTVTGSRSDKEKARKFLNTQLIEYEKRLTLAELKLAEFKQKNVGMMPNQGVGYYGRLQGAMDSKEKVLSDLKVARQRVSILRKQLQGGLPATGTESAIDKQILTHMQDLDKLLLQYTSQHPDVVAKKEIIIQLRKQKLVERDKKIEIDSDPNSTGSRSASLNPVYSSIKIALQDAEVEVKTLESKLYEQNRKIQKLNSLVGTIPEVEAQLIRLNRDYNVVKIQYETLLERLESANLTEKADRTSDGVRFRIVEPPRVPLYPSSPNRGKLLFTVLLAGIGAGLGLMFLMLQLRPVYNSSAEIMESLELPVFGSVKIKWNDIQKSKLKLELTSFASAGVLLLVFFTVFLIFNDSGSYFLQSLYRNDIGAG